MPVNKRRLLIIGLDGATFDIISPLSEMGRLPNLREIMDGGVRGILESSIPPHSFPAWSTFLTGLNPGKHGVFFAMAWDPKSYQGRIYSGNDIRAPLFFQIPGPDMRETGIINYPMLYPPVKINGFMVTGMLTPSLKSGFTWPEGLGREILSKMDYQIEPFHGISKDEYLEDIHACLRKRRDLTLHLMKNKRWDTIIVVFTELDRIQHDFWDGLEMEHFEKLGMNPGRYRTAIPLFYEALDRAVGEIVDEAGKDTTVLIVSDHGFEPCLSTFHVNEFLRQRGLLHAKEGTWGRNLAGRLLSIAKRHPFWRSVQKGISKTRWKRFERRHNALTSGIVWEKTRAYCGPDGGISINLKGRERDGIVDEEEGNELKRYIIEELDRVVDPSSGRKVIRKAFLKEEVYDGPFTPSAPDIVFLLDRGAACWDANVPSPCEAGPERGITAGHSLEGIFIARGEGIKKGARIQGARMLDMTPTILYLSGCPVPEYMDGNLLEDAFEDPFLRENPLEKVELELTMRSEEHYWTSEEKKIIEERLKGLGYI